MFGVSYYFYLLWTLAQAGYYSVFGRMMWLPDILYAGEGAGFLGDVLASFGALWWVGGILLIGLGVFLIVKFPDAERGFWKRIPFGITALAAVGR